MSSKEKLIIHKLNFEIEINSQEDFKHYADRISILTNTTLPAKLQTVLDQFEIPQGHLTINQLSIDLGDIPPHTFEKTIIDGIVNEIKAFLSKNIKLIKQEISQGIFRTSLGGKYEVHKTEFAFQSEISVEKSTVLQDEIKKRKIVSIDLNDFIMTEGYKLRKKPKAKSAPKQNEQEENKESVSVKKQNRKEPGLQTNSGKEEAVDLTSTAKPVTKEEFSTGKDKTAKQKAELVKKGLDIASTAPEIILKSGLPASIKPDAVPQKNEVSELIARKPTKQPKQLTTLDKAFIYYLKYGRLPSNVKYVLGTSMLDIFNINQQDDGFLDELSTQIKNDEQAKRRLGSLLDQTAADSEFNPRIPKSFEDYFTALIHGLPVEIFSAGTRRYDLNDMIRFLYADSPNKLKKLIRYLLMEYDSSANWSELVDDLFNKISKPSIVKLLSSFVRKGAYLNKALNNLNRTSSKGNKHAHGVLFKLLISDGNTSTFDFDITPRKYFSESPNYSKQDYDNKQLVNYFLKYGSLPYSLGINMELARLNSSILFLVPSQISELSFFKNKAVINYESIGKLSEEAIAHLIKSLNPNLQDDIKTNYHYFKYNIESGIPETFQKAFMLHYALKTNRKSYLEEMISYWKEQFGDADQVISQRWKTKEELKKELNLLLVFTTKKIADELKVDFTYDSYAKDISVKNAGLVILWPFLKVYFNMLDLLNDEGNFRSMKERARACHLLQYLAIQRSYGEEFYYPLNKILTGYPLDEPLPYEIAMTKKEIDVSNALLKNVITQWNALKGGSVDGLRGSFLVRDGVLVPTPNGWLLTVENKAYDILMDKMPWGIGMIKLSWAPYVLNVEWERKIM